VGTPFHSYLKKSREGKRGERYFLKGRTSFQKEKSAKKAKSISDERIKASTFNNHYSSIDIPFMPQVPFSIDRPP